MICLPHHHYYPDQLVQRWLTQSGARLEQIAVLVRNSYQAIATEETFILADIPYHYAKQIPGERRKTLLDNVVSRSLMGYALLADEARVLKQQTLTERRQFITAMLTIPRLPLSDEANKTLNKLPRGKPRGITREVLTGSLSGACHTSSLDF